MRKLSYKYAVSFLVAASTLNLFLPSKAQSSWSYNPFTGTSTWLTLSRSLAYPLNRLSTTGVPLYIANPLIYGAAYGGTQALTGGQRQGYYGNNQTQQQPGANGQYTDPNAPNVGRTRNRPFGFASGVADQVSYQRRSQQLPNQASNQDAALLSGADSALRGEPKPAPPSQSSAPALQPPPSFQSPPSYQPPAGGFQPRAKGRGWSHGRNGRSSGSPLSASGSAPTSSNPMAQGFITLVNEKYDGDISRALFDPEMRSYAQSIGLIDSDKLFQANLSNERSQLIRQILSDQREDPASRISAVRLLLKH